VLPNFAGKSAVERNLNWKTLFKINEWQLDSNDFHKRNSSKRQLKKILFFLLNMPLVPWHGDLIKILFMIIRKRVFPLENMHT